MRERIAGYIGIGGPSETCADQWEVGDDQVRKRANGSGQQYKRERGIVLK